MQIPANIDFKRLERLGLITIRANFDRSLFIINYTPKVQYDGLWATEEGLVYCRGLVVDALTWRIVARPFRKFFNIEEHSPLDIPNEPFEVTEKVDGSLGIGFYYKNVFYIATRGSFNSEQAIKANDIFKKYDFVPAEGLTYLWEIIYPENRIVVDYKGEEKLVLLAVVDTDTGAEIPLTNVHFPDKVRVYNGIERLSVLKKMEETNKEGFVVRFKSGMRVKVKFEEYKRLHRILTGVSNKSIWEYLRDGKDIGEIINNVPDEFFEWVKATAYNLIADYNYVSFTAKGEYERLMKTRPQSRKEFALEALKFPYPSLLFGLYDNNSIKKNIWDIIKPKYEQAFKTEL